jgi:hypothetical protein
MIGRIEARLRLLRRKLSRTHWLLRFLHLSISEGPANRPGLVMLQIDGLSLEQFNHALTRVSSLPEAPDQAGTLPGAYAVFRLAVFDTRRAGENFLRDKNRRAGLFVPGPGEGRNGPHVRTGDGATGGRRTARTTGQGGASIRFARAAVHTRIFSVAVRTRMKRTSAPRLLGWGSALRAANPFALLFMLVTNINSVIRILILLVVELVIALVDLVRGLYHGRNYIKELKFIPARVAVSVSCCENCA